MFVGRGGGRARSNGERNEQKKTTPRGLPECLQIVLIVAVLANVVILYVGEMAGSGQRSKSEKKVKRPNAIRKTITVPHGIIRKAEENMRSEGTAIEDSY